MKITYIIDGLSAGGKERQFYYLLKEISQENNIQVVVLNNEIFFNEVYNLTIELIVIPKGTRYRFTTIKRIYNLLKSFKPDIIHLWDNISHCIALPYIILNDVKVINGSIRHAGAIRKNIWIRIIYKLAYLTSDIIVSNSRQGLVVEKLHKKKNSITIYNGINADDLQHKNNNVRESYKELVFNDYSIVMIGRFYPLKDYITYIKAAKLILSNQDNITFYCVGDGPDRSAAEKESGNWINKNIFFLDTRKDIYSLLLCFDIGIMLNNTNGHAEGISNAIMEYMAAELPVIATNAGGTPEIVKHEESGFLVPPFDEKIVAEKIRYLIGNVNIMRAMGERGRDIIKNDFSLHKMIKLYYNLYESITKYSGDYI